MEGRSSVIPRLHKLPIADRLRLVAKFSDLTESEISDLSGLGSIPEKHRIL